MKKISILLMSVFCFSIIMAGCNFKNLAVPEEVKVKMDATYEFPIASFDSEKNEKLDISKYFDLEQLIGGSNDEEEQSESATPNFNIYKYYDGHSQYQQYLLHMPIKEIDFDFSSAFENFDVSKAIKGFNINQEFSIPDVGGINENKEVDLTSIEAAVNSAVTFTGFTQPEDLTVAFISSQLGLGSFESVEYLSGKFVIDTNNSLGGDVDGKMTLLEEDGTTVASATFVNNKAELDISGKKLHSGMKLRYSDYSYPSLGKGFSATISSGSKIKVAKGVTIPSNLFSIPPVNVEVPVSLGDNLRTVTINEGTLSVLLEDPDSWEGNVISNYEINITGSINCNVDKANNTFDFSVQPKQLTSGKINAAASIDIVLNDATIDFEDKPSVFVRTNIQKISAVVKMPNSFNPSIDETKPIPTDVTNFVTNIKWNKLGFEVKATNDLPSGNNMALNISSNFLGIQEGTAQTIIAGLKDEAGNPKEQVLSFINQSPEEGPLFETPFIGENAKTEMDITGSISLNTDEENNIIVSNVSPGQTYHISLVVDPVFDWASADIKMPENLDSFSGSFNTHMNKKAMFDSLGEDVAARLNEIKIDSIPLYLFANVPNLSIFDETGFGGAIRAFYGREVEGTDERGNATTVIQPVVDPHTASDEEVANSEVWILGSRADENNPEDDGKETLAFSPMPAIVKNQAGEVTTDFGNSTINFADALNLTTNDNEATLCIDYDVGLSGAARNLTITSESLEELKQNGKCSIALDLALVLTLDFTLEDQISFNLLDLMKSSEDEGENTEGEGSDSENTEGEESQSNNDILGREGKTDMGQFEDYIDLVEYAGITIENFKLPISGELGLNIKVPAQDENSEDFEKNILIGGKATNIDITREDLRTFLNTYPLDPEVNLVIGKEGRGGTFGLLRNAPVSGKIKVKVKAKGEIPVFPFAEKNNEEGGSN